jgi:hypothetical protein
MFADPDFVRLGLRRMIPPERITASPSGREGTPVTCLSARKSPGWDAHWSFASTLADSFT